MINNQYKSPNVLPDSSSKSKDTRKLFVHWDVTATTIYCDQVKNYVTIKISKDWSKTCIYHQKWGNIRRENKKGIIRLIVWMGFVKGEKHITVDDCKGSEICPNVQECLEKVYQQEVN
jgi:hypothetical protein